MTSLVDAHPGFEGLVGLARADITPPVGIFARNWGAAEHDVAEGIHRPLTATALSLRSSEGGNPALLLSLDLGWWRRPEDEWEIRSAVLDALGLDAARVLIALTHTHAGPCICRADADRPGGELVGPYMDHLREAVASVARQAVAAEQPGRLEWTTGRCGLAHNRDLPDPDANRLLCGYHPGGPVDDTLLVGRATAADGRIVGSVVNYACHPTTLAWENRLISPDYVGALREVVENATGGAPCLFLQGASGELAPRRQYAADPAVADRNGEEVGHAVLSALAGMLPPGEGLQYAGALESGAPLALWHSTPVAGDGRLECRRADVEVDLQPWPTLAEIDRQMAGTSDRAVAERLARKRRIRAALGDGSTAPMPLWGWRIGGACLVALPNEAYSLLQRTVREALRGVPVVVAAIVNGHTGYLPPTELYDRNAYPVWQTPFGRGCLERVTVAATDEVARLTGEEPR